MRGRFLLIMIIIFAAVIFAAEQSKHGEDASSETGSNSYGDDFYRLVVIS